MSEKLSVGERSEQSSEDHRRNSKSLILQTAAQGQTQMAVVLGCGRCSEIPIETLSETFDHIDLVDINDYSLFVVRQRSRTWTPPPNSLDFHIADLTGIIAQIEERAIGIVSQSYEPLSCLKKLGHLLLSTPPHFWAASEDRQYDLIVCSGILTQLQASVRNPIEAMFKQRFPQHVELLNSYHEWRRMLWDFARRLEDAFMTYLEQIAAPQAMVYLSDTIHVCWVELRDGELVADGAWLASRTARLADYLTSSFALVEESNWEWLREETEGPYWGRLYGVQALICRFEPE